MTKQELKALGLSEDDVLNKLVDRLFEHYANGEEEISSTFQSRLTGAIQKKVDERLDRTMQKHVLPKIASMVDGITLQETNKWGEKLGNKLTFIEYLVQRTDAYIREEVNHNGKTREQDSYSWNKHSTRIAYMIHEHLQYHISRAVTEALGNVTSSVRKGLEEAVKLAIDNIKVTVDTKVVAK